MFLHIFNTFIICINQFIACISSFRYLLIFCLLGLPSFERSILNLPHIFVKFIYLLSSVCISSTFCFTYLSAMFFGDCGIFFINSVFLVQNISKTALMSL